MERLTPHKDFIRRSHQRCDAMKIGRSRIYSKRILEGGALFEKLSDHQLLIGTAEPFMHQLYSFVKGTEFFALLTDSKGCILTIIGDETILSEAFSYKMMPGAYMDEGSIGTNAMGTALAEEMPVQISGDEHYIEAYHKWTCSASPIRDTSGAIIGVLDLTGYCELVHPHTLGMVVAAAKAIERMLQVQEYNHALEMAKLYNETIIDSISAGILTAGLDGTIKTVNHYAPELFGYTTSEIRGMKAWQLFDGWNQVLSASSAHRNLAEEEVMVNSRKNKLMLTLSTYPIISSQKDLMDIVMVFKDVKKVRKLANRIMGRKAIYTFDKIVGENKQFKRVVEFAKKVADSRSGILIQGESGTGKELFAQAIHNHSSRREEAFVAMNCGAIPKTLIEAELFGYEEGAFTGAKNSGNPGKFEIADGGTLFLDEIGEMPLDMQTRLLRVLEEGTISRVGSNKACVVDVRIIAATNKNLQEEVSKGNFRKDLYYRLNVLPILLPPLRQRKDDLPLLIDYFTQRLSKRLNKKPLMLTDPQLAGLMAYDWPGNVRELENFIELMIHTEAVPAEFRHEQLPHPAMAAPALVPSAPGPDEDLPLAEIQRRHILQVFNKYNGNISLSAKALGIARNTLYRNLEMMGKNCSKFDQ